MGLDMTTHAELFHRVAEALYGEQYIAPLATLLEVDKESVRKWAAGKMPIPAGVWRELREWVGNRYAELAACITELDKREG